MSTKPRWISFFLSVLVHVAGGALLMGAGSVFSANAPVLRHYQVLMLPKETPKQDKVIWYDFRASVPEVSPGRPFGPGKIAQGIKDPAGRTVIAQSPEPASNKQFIWQPDRPEPIPADVPVPNQVVLQTSSPKVPLKQFAPPTPASPPPGKPPAVALIDPVPVVEAPKLPLTMNTLGDLAKQDPASLPPRPRFVAPSKAPMSNSMASLQPLPEAPPPGGATGVTGEGLKTVIVGLDPAPGPSPPGSRPGQFSRAPTAGPPSSGPSPQPGAPTVPGLMSHSAPGAPAESAPVPVSVPIPERHLLKDLVLPSINRTMSVPLRPSSRIIPASVETRFPGRDVYTLLIPGPNLPEYTGDWVLWFSERHPPDDHAARIVAPVPALKYYLTGATAATPQESGTIQLASIVDHNGHVSGVRILRGGATGEAFRAKAIEELETWEFQPAFRNGEAIDVDVVLEISFRFGAAQPAR